MCGRFILSTSPEELVEHLGLDQPPSLTAREHIAPTQLVAVAAPKGAEIHDGLGRPPAVSRGVPAKQGLG